VFHVHRPGQGKVSRTVTFLGAVFLLAWGCRSMLYALPLLSKDLSLAWNEILMDASVHDAWRVDLVLLESPFSPALTISVALLVGGGLWLFWFLNRPKVADQLVEMEAELRKVSWPTLGDAWQSTLVVSGFTALIVVLVFVYDIVIKAVIDLLPVNRIV